MNLIKYNEYVVLIIPLLTLAIDLLLLSTWYLVILLLILKT